MVGHKKQYNIVGMVDNKQKVKVKEEGSDIMKREKERRRKVEVDAEEEEKKKEEEKDKQKEKKKQMDRKKEKKAWKEAKDKEEKEKNTKKEKREKEKEEEEEQKERKEKERKEKEKEEGEQKKRKEKEKEEEQKERKENENKTKNIYSHFYKVLIHESCTEQLKLPLAFNKHLKNEFPGVVYLKGPSGNTWRVELVPKSKELCFVHGWKEFVSDHRIKLGYFLVFCYDGRSQFSVQVFDQTGCEMQYAFLAQPSNNVVPEVGVGDMGSNADGTSQNDLGDMGSNGDGTSQDGVGDMGRNADCTSQDGVGDMISNVDGTPQDDVGDGTNAGNTSKDDEWDMGNDATDTSEDDVWDMGSDALDTSQDDDTDMEIGAISTTKTLALQDTNRTVMKGPREFDGSIRKRYRKIDDIMANDYPSKKCKAEDKRSGASSDYVSSKLVKSNKIRSSEKHVSLQSNVLSKSKDVARPSTVVTKVQIRPQSISQRRPITEKEMEDVVERAAKFQSERPFTQKIMKFCEVYMTYFMIIPRAFMQKHLPKYSRTMTLWDPQGKRWNVSYIYHGNRSSAAFSTGWGAFAVGNNLEKSDVCVFELLDKEYNIKVHIYRVLREITPCILRSGLK